MPAGLAYDETGTRRAFGFHSPDGLIALAVIDNVLGGRPRALGLDDQTPGLIKPVE